MITLLILSAALYVLLHLYLQRGLTKSLSLDESTSSELPPVTVIVAGRNEAANIVRCIDSLSAIKYPPDRLEIILVNDRSEDDTLRLMTEATAGKPQFKVINSREITHPNLKGKPNAVDTAIGIASGKIIMCTDADCTVQESWALDTVKYFKPGVAMVCGYTLIRSGGSLFAKMQSLDWLYLLTLASASCGLHRIMSCIGNNLSFTKEDYYSVGGYSEIGFSVTEDLALMRKMSKLKGRDIVYPVNANCVVTTEPCADAGELSSQKRRWFRGGTGINSLGYVTGVALYAGSFFLLFGFIFAGFKLWLAYFVIIMLTQLYLMTRPALKFREAKQLVYTPLFAVYFAAYGLLLPLSFIFGNSIRWKGRKF